MQVSYILLIKSQKDGNCKHDYYVTLGNLPTLIVNICSYAVFYVVYIVTST